MTKETMMMMTAVTTETMATETTEAGSQRSPAVDSVSRRAVSRRLRWVPSSLRTRILVPFIGFLALTVVSSVLVTREVLLIRLDQRIHAELVQEAAELRRLARGNDPTTGRAFGGRVRRIFDVYLDRNVPSRNEAFIMFVDGRLYVRSRAVVPYRLDRDPELVALWGTAERPDRGRVETPAGRVEYLAVPLRSADRTRGVFVAAIFHDRQKAEIEAAVRAAGGVGLGILLIGSLLAWRLARRTVAPVESLTTAARSISGTDLSRRIPVSGYDEVAQLAETFNEMVDRLERAFASQRRFVDDAGHELKTPLTIVRGHLELLGDDPVERRQTLRLVLEELDRMHRIVDDLLLLAKRGQPDFLRLATVEVGTLTDTVHAKLTALAAREWVVESRGRGVVVADRQRLTQAMVQLADNAARVTNEGEEIRIGSGIAGDEARFWVSDRGRGIAVAEQSRIFERFRRGGDTSRSEGAGLGLAIVKAIAEAHDGRVEVASRPGEGATFTIVIPVDQPAAPNEVER
jgi:two-component system, OmpR family, sensor kinase